jgi:hypothetical protein
MRKTLNTIIAIALVGLFPALSLYAGTQGDGYTKENAVLIATQFMKSSPTYSFDGIEDSIAVISVDTARMPYSWMITIKFTSRNSGYGNRTDQMVLTVLTDHEMVILVQDDQVISAKTDGKFDEINETFLDQDTPENAEEIALEWLRNAPTFSFDGIEGSMKVDEIVIAESYPVQYFITISFDCSHPGYGDRTDQVLAQVITSHKAVVVVSSGVVRSAVIDEVWNEMEVLDAPVLYVTPDMFPEFAVQYILNNYVVDPETEVVSSWTEIDESGSLVGYTVIIYEAGNWVVKVEYPVVAEPIYKVSVNYTGESSFSWIGSIDTRGETTTEFTDLEAKEQLLLLPGEAVEIAVTYVFSNYEELSDVEKPSRWIEEGVRQ